jgi:hypothetical protein
MLSEPPKPPPAYDRFTFPVCITCRIRVAVSGILYGSILVYPSEPLFRKKLLLILRPQLITDYTVSIKVRHGSLS